MIIILWHCDNKYPVSLINNALDNVPYLVTNFPGVVDYLTTEISTSKQKKFSLVTFVDTPGLVDGDMKYPFDVDYSILWLGELLIIYRSVSQCLNYHIQFAL